MTGTSPYGIQQTEPPCEGLFALKESCFCIPMIHGALNITVFTARGKMPREVKGQHVAQIPAVL